VNKPMSKRWKWIVTGIAAVCFVVGLLLAHRIEPGVRVQEVTLAEDSPALKFIPDGSGSHPVALLAHGFTGTKESLYRYAEAFTAAGFVCYVPDLPGHGESQRTFTITNTVETLGAIARQIGPVDVFAGHSMGGFTGGEAVREGGMRPGLFIAIGSFPVLGDHAPPMLILLGRYEEGGLTSRVQEWVKTRKDARLVVSPHCDHVFEAFDSILVNAAVEAACASVHRTPSGHPSAWRWRLLGAILAIVAAGKLASCLTDLFPPLARFRGLSIAVFVVLAFMLTISGKWIDATPHWRFFPKQGIAMAVVFLLARLAGKWRIPRWSFAVLGVLAMVMAFVWLKASGSFIALLIVLFTIAFTPTLILGAAIGGIAARRGSRPQGDIAMAIIAGCAAFQWFELPRMAASAPIPHIAIKLSSQQYDTLAGEYEFPPDNLNRFGMRLTIWRQDSQLMAKEVTANQSTNTFEMYPESETNFFVVTNDPQEFTFVKNDQGEVAAVTLQLNLRLFNHDWGLPNSRAEKIKKE
jgi:hypothetical protein